MCCSLLTPNKFTVAMLLKKYKLNSHKTRILLSIKFISVCYLRFVCGSYVGLKLVQQYAKI